jgi:glycosyltransferase involved in cell wall biosynthesis
MPDLWLVVPAYNEGRRLARTLTSLIRFEPNVVVVDDGSRDDTSTVALQHNVDVVRHVINCGQGAALQTGIDYALQQGAQYVVTFDGDGQHCVDDIDALVAPLRRGEADVALGSRFLGRTEGITASRWLILKAGVLFTRIFSRIRVTDTHNGLRAFSRHAAQRIRITQNRMAHASEILDEVRRFELRFVEVPVTIHYNADTLAKGQSSWNAVKIATEFLLGRVIH